MKRIFLILFLVPFFQSCTTTAQVGFICVSNPSLVRTKAIDEKSEEMEITTEDSNKLGTTETTDFSLPLNLKLSPM